MGHACSGGLGAKPQLDREAERQPPCGVAGGALMRACAYMWRGLLLGCSCSSCSKCFTTPLVSTHSRNLRAHTARRLAQFVATAFQGM